MPIALACPRCDNVDELDDVLASRKGRCKQCGTVFAFEGDYSDN